MEMLMMRTFVAKKRTLQGSIFMNLAFSCRCFHELLPSHSSVSEDVFLSSLKWASISRVGFLRHGKTAPATDGVDFNRLLTDEGRLQAKEAGESFGRELLPFFPKVVVSPAPRTIETAKIFLEAAGCDDSIELNPVQLAYDGTMQPEGSVLFKKLGYSPLLSYLDNDDANDRAAAQKVLGKYASDMAKAIVDVARSDDTIELKGEMDGWTLWFVGHAIYLPSAALAVASLAYCNDAAKDLILTTSTQEAEGYLIDIQQPSVRYLARPSNR